MKHESKGITVKIISKTLIEIVKWILTTSIFVVLKMLKKYLDD